MTTTARLLALTSLAAMLACASAHAQGLGMQDFEARRRALRQEYLAAGSAAEKAGVLARFRQLELQRPDATHTPAEAESLENLLGREDARVAERPAGATGLGARGGEGPASPRDEAADARLARLQQGAVDSALGELRRGVHEEGGDNRGPDVERYLRTAGAEPGQMWCGAFAAWNLGHAAGEGGRFTGAAHLASDRKAQSFFMYRDYSSQRMDDARREADRAAGTSRRYMTFAGSSGDAYARSHHLDHEVYSSPRDLPARPGDVVVMRGHVAMVESYDPATGILHIVEGNAGAATDRVGRRTLDLNRAAHRDSIQGIGRPSIADFGNLDASGSRP